MSESTSATVSTARDYYNSSDADRFYHTIWGGEDIHIGLYEADDEPIADASRRTVDRMAGLVAGLGDRSRVLDVGAGYGGAARRLAGRFGCHVTALNLSEVENERNRQLNREQDLEDRIDVVDGNFENLPFEDQSFDLVWSQDAILHSGARDRVLAEIVRVLRPGGTFVFTDPMQADDCPAGVLQPILDRIHLASLGSPGFYLGEAERHQLRRADFHDLTHQLVNHYSRVLAETSARADELVGHVSDEYVAKMKKGLGHWIDGGRNGHLAWGIFHFEK